MDVCLLLVKHRSFCKVLLILCTSQLSVCPVDRGLCFTTPGGVAVSVQTGGFVVCKLPLAIRNEVMNSCFQVVDRDKANAVSVGSMWQVVGEACCESVVFNQGQ